MSWLFENSTPTIIVGVIVVGLLGLGLVRTGRGVLLWAMVGVAALVGLLILVELFVVTDFERVESTLEQAAAALNGNDAPALVALIDPGAGNMRSQVASEMDRFRIDSAKFNKLKVQFNYYTSPPSAEAEFLGVLQFEDRAGLMTRGSAVSPVRVFLHKVDDRWLMRGYDENFRGISSR
jgi:hypothetical protein